MKKQVFYKTCKKRGEKKITVEKAEGYIYELKDVDGKPFKVALEYDRPFWKATELSTGLSFNPIQDKNKMELLKKLSLLQVNKALEREHFTEHKKRISDFKESENLSNS